MRNLETAMTSKSVILRRASTEHIISLAGVPPIGVKADAECWEETPSSGNAQCTFDCVSVTLMNGSMVYPVVRSKY